ncbi:MAG TPA: hypothetical protein VJV04_05830 [Nitrospiraceae bacterium]|nr:hypothetical protein [Nitrospiraceae bacterium]
MTRIFAMVVSLCWMMAVAASAFAASASDVFSALTQYVARQVETDKVVFVGAQRCTEWFYKQLKQKPPRSQTHTIAFTPVESDGQSDSTSECRTRYPDGLESARHAFSQAQSALSISLTFYELALVGDRDDNHRYSEDELKDLLDSFKLPFQDLLPAMAHVDALTAQFDLARKGNTLEAVMISMGLLYDKGYRLTTGDRIALNTLSG